MVYMCTVWAAFFAFAAYHLDSFDEEKALATSDALLDMSILMMALFAMYDIFTVPFFNRVADEGQVNSRAFVQAIGAVFINAGRMVCALMSTLFVRDLMCLPDDPYTARDRMVPTHPTRSKRVDFGASKDGRSMEGTSEKTTRESGFGQHINTCALTLFGGPIWTSDTQAKPHQTLKTDKQEESQWRRALRRGLPLPGLTGRVTMRRLQKAPTSTTDSTLDEYHVRTVFSLRSDQAGF